MKKKDPIKDLEILRDWNKDIATSLLLKSLKDDWSGFYKLEKSYGKLFEMNQRKLDEIITEMKKLKKKN